MADDYLLPRELARYSRRGSFAPDELREACREAGEGLGRADARGARFRSAAEMVEMWRGLDLPAWIAPYALRDARLGYLAGYEEALVAGELAEDTLKKAAEVRWGNDWPKKLSAVRERRAKD
ncbi:MAG TPA: hypothetical protein VHF46_00045 [Rubrobacteraceae bacterium]|nr:hypothetical protein [Rubrobacteraceae bacterium]